MAIVTLNKLTLCGMIADKTAVLSQLQALGLVHLIPLQAKKPSTEDSSPESVVDAIAALKYLQQSTRKRHQVHQNKQFNFDQIVQDVLTLKENLTDLIQQRDFLEERIKEVALWGDFSFAEDGELLGYKLWFYIVPKRLMNKVRDSDLIWQRVSQNNTLEYIVLLAKEEPEPKAMPVPRTHTGDISLSQLHKNLEAIHLAIEDAYAKREYLTRWMTLIMLNLAEFENDAGLKSAVLMTKDDAHLFTSQAWVAEADIKKIEAFAKEQQVAYLVEPVNGIEQPPTLLSNTETFAGGEEIVKFYQMPNYYGWDPSIVVFFSFALFFAMILSDAGYAAVFLSVLAFKWKKMGLSKQGLRFRMLLIVTLNSALLWGILAGSYFGFSPAESTVLGKIKLFDMNDFDIMMKLSIFVGVAHIAFANLVQAYELKKSSLRYSSLGWALFVIGGFILWLSTEEGANIVLQQLAYGCLSLAVLALLLFSSERPLNRPVDYILRLFDGIKNLTSITKIFGDVLSYMRLFALGLASASLAITFNQLAIQVYEAIPGIGLLLSLILLIIGHGLNIMLGIMSGVVHGLRLNFIEFYNWSVSDEGYPFKVFSKKEEY